MKIKEGITQNNELSDDRGKYYCWKCKYEWLMGERTKRRIHFAIRIDNKLFCKYHKRIVWAVYIKNED